MRRSRKIGRTQGGRVKNGRAREKFSHRSPPSLWWELSQHRSPRRHFVENPSRDFYHPASIAEYEGVLARLPKKLKKGIRSIVLRRPRAAEQMRGTEAWRRFGVIAILAMPKSLTYQWPYRVTDGIRRHYDPWCRTWELSHDRSVLHWSESEVRRYYLYHLFLHEIGHTVDDRHQGRLERESFAEDFALDWARRLGVIEPGEPS